MDSATKKGIGFGLTSGIITTLGLMVGLDSGTGSRLVVLGGILTIAIADSFSDSLGMHISEETGTRNSDKKVRETTIATFLAKFFLALSFAIPIILFELQTAIIIGIIWGFLWLTCLTLYEAKRRKSNQYIELSLHLGVATTVVVLTYFVGKLVSIFFV